jgi:MFS family permease
MRSSSLKQLYVLMATVFVDMMGFMIVVPTLPFHATRLGARPFVVTAIVSSFFAAQMISAPLWGRFSDRFGRRPALIWALSISAVAFALFGFASSIALLFLFRLVQGAGGGTTGVVQAYVSDSVPPAERTKALGWISASTNAGVALGGSLGSVAAHLGSAGPGLVAAGLCILNAIFAWRWLPESKTDAPAAKPGAKAESRQPLGEAILRVLKHPSDPVSSLIWIYALGMLAFVGMNGILGLYFPKAYGVTETTMGYFYTYIGIISFVMRAVLLGPAVQRFGEVGVLRLGTWSLVAGFALMPLPAVLPCGAVGRIAVLALVLMLIPIGTALLFPATSGLVSQRAARADSGQTLGVQQSFGSVARLLGPLCAGALFEVDMRFPFWGASAVMLLAVVLGARQRAAPIVETPPVEVPVAGEV